MSDREVLTDLNRRLEGFVSAIEDSYLPAVERFAESGRPYADVLARELLACSARTERQNEIEQERGTLATVRHALSLVFRNGA
jgi:hypothetical protein